VINTHNGASLPTVCFRYNREPALCAWDSCHESFFSFYRNFMDNPNDSATEARRYNSRLGLILFAFYSVLYAAFVLISAFATDVMDTIVVAGLNLAIVYGFGLIIAALVLALIYGAMCHRDGDAS
jgi:uncharacterized membrane protein (DUF485 family)